MTRSINQKNYVDFSRGLVTEGTPFTFPENASLIEENFVLTPGGRRKRRKGVSEVIPLIEGGPAQDIADVGKASTCYLWRQVNGSELTFLVVQIGTFLQFYSVVADQLILLGERKVQGLEDDGTLCDFSDFAGNLVVVIPTSEQILTVSYDESRETALRFRYLDLLIRDTFGITVESLEATIPVTERPTFGVSNTEKPVEQSSNIYNLRNQGWAITTARESEGGSFPSPENIATAKAKVTSLEAQYSAALNREKVENDTGGPTPPSLTEENRYRIPADVTTQVGSSSTTSTSTPSGPSSSSIKAELDQAKKDLDTILTLITDPLQISIQTLLNPVRLPAAGDFPWDIMFKDGYEFRTFHPDILINKEPSNFPAPRGKFILKATLASDSRVDAAIEHDNSTYGKPFDSRLQQHEMWPNVFPKSSIYPSDNVGGGPSCVETFNGRIFYGGFKGNPSVQTPLSSYILYSQVTQNENNANRCYQVNDPTDPEKFDLLPTDGGVILLEGAVGITSIQEYQGGVAVFATNGIWFISGSGDQVFSATSQSVVKVSNVGCVSRDSIVKTDSGILFWGIDGVYALGRNQYGSFETQNVTETSIKSLFTEMTADSKLSCYGMYSENEGRVRWVYQEEELNRSVELVFDLRLSAFTLNTISSQTDSNPYVTAVFETPPLGKNQADLTVTTTTEDIVTDTEGENIWVSEVFDYEGQPETYYLVRRDRDEEGNYTNGFAEYGEDTFVDWKQYDLAGEGLDAEAVLLTGFLGSGDIQRFQQAPYLFFYLNKTETGFEEINGDIEVVGQSSCIVQVQWDWANSPSSGKWSKPFQAYRQKRIKMYEGGETDYDNGTSMVVTRNKVRGKGRVMSILIKTEPGKDLDLYGWSVLISGNGNV